MIRGFHAMEQYEDDESAPASAPRRSRVVVSPQLWRSFEARSVFLWPPRRLAREPINALESVSSTPTCGETNRPKASATVAFVTLSSREWPRREGRPCRNLAFDKKRPGEIALRRASLAARTGGIPAATLYVLSAGARVNIISKINAAGAKTRGFLVKSAAL
jgi:hypothetical protein